MSEGKTQHDKFRDAPHDPETDDEARFDERMKNLVKQKPDSENDGRRST